MSAPAAPAALRHPLLQACRVPHGFGVRGAPDPPDCVRPRQVHGCRVALATGTAPASPGEADAIVSRRPGPLVGVVTADCVPVLAATRDGAAVAAIHAGWRGLAQGVLEAGIAVLREDAGGAALVAVVGPHIGPCCYEVDEPVLAALRPRFGGGLEAALRPSRPGHHLLDLGALARLALARAGLEADETGGLEGACTRCDAVRFHSFRRDGARAGRLLHFVGPREDA